MLNNWYDFGYFFGLVLLAPYMYGREISQASRDYEPDTASGGSYEPIVGSVSGLARTPFSYCVDEEFASKCGEPFPKRAAGKTRFRRVMPYGRQESLVRWCEINSGFIRGPGQKFGQFQPETATPQRA